MLSWAGRAWRMWRAKAQLMAPYLSSGGHSFADYDLHFSDLPGGLPGVQLVEGDFRSVRLGRTFDAVVCGFNTLNYLSEAGELGAVFRVVAEHLRPGGVFVFDTITEQGMRITSGLYVHVQVDEARFVLRFAYDAVRRQQKVEALLPAGVEVHCRVPIDPADVVRVSRGTRLQVYDYFSSAIVPGWVSTGRYCFFVLTRQR